MQTLLLVVDVRGFDAVDPGDESGQLGCAVRAVKALYAELDAP